MAAGVRFPDRLRMKLGEATEFRMGVWRINVELQDGTIVHDLFTNGKEIYRLVGWDAPNFTGQRGDLPFGEVDIKDVQPA